MPDDKGSPSTDQILVKFMDVSYTYMIYSNFYNKNATIESLMDDILKNYTLYYSWHVDFLQPPYLAEEQTLEELNLPHNELTIQTDLCFITGDENAVIKVKLDDDKTVTVAIFNDRICRSVLGGYQHVCNNKIYHHTWTQTGPSPDEVPPWNKAHRDTQTIYVRNRRTKQPYARAQQTQSYHHNFWINNVANRIVRSGQYETADEWEARIKLLEKIEFLQKCCRAAMIRKKLHEQSDEYHKRMRLAHERRVEERLEDQHRKTIGLIGKVLPLSEHDVAVLFSMLQKWKKKELDSIRMTYSGPAKIVHEKVMLEKELEVLKGLRNARARLKGDIEVATIVKVFREVGLPITWTTKKLTKVSMDTLETQKARQYFYMYKQLYDCKTFEQYHAVFDVLRNELFGHKCAEGMQILKLIDRVSTMMDRKLPKASWEVSVMMIQFLFYQHLFQDSCNNGMTDRMRRLKEKSMEKNLEMCLKCNKLCNREVMFFNGNVKKLRICKMCNWKYGAEIDMPPYKFILKQIRKYERLHNGTSSMCFILQDSDVYKIISDIWHNHSALSESKDIYELRLPRWDKRQEWSPWNCILLTNKEAIQHLKIEDLKTVYDEAFCNHILDKHVLSKTLFKQMIYVDRHFSNKMNLDPRLDGEKEYIKFVPVNSKLRIYYSCH